MAADSSEQCRYTDIDRLVTGNVLTTSTNVSSLFGTNSVNRSENPVWRDRVANHQQAGTPYSRTTHKVRPAMMQAAVINSLNGQHIYRVRSSIGTAVAFTAMPGLLDIDSRSFAMCRNKMASRLESFQSLIPIGEMRETAGLYRNMVDTSIGLMKELIRIRKTHKLGVKSAKAAADAWLLYNFGITPLLNDVDSALASIGATLERNRPNVVADGFATSSWNSSGATTTIAGPNGYSFVGNTYRRHTYSCFTTAGYQPLLQSGNDYSGLQRHFGVTLGDVIPAVWELTYASWIVDYFTNAGSYLEDSFTSLAGNPVYCTISRKYAVDTNIRFVTVKQPGLPNFSLSDLPVHSPGSASSVLITRTITSMIPHQRFYFKNFDEIGKSGLKKLLNLASVLVQRVS